MNCDQHRPTILVGALWLAWVLAPLCLFIVVGCNEQGGVRKPEVRSQNSLPPLPTMARGAATAATAAAATAPGGTVSAVLAFDPSPSPDVKGYRIYYGAKSGTYTNSVSTGTNLTVTISNLVRGVKYFFAATAYDAGGMESAFSNEATFPIPQTNHVVMGFKTNGVIAFQGIYTNPPGDVVLFTPFIHQTNNDVRVVRLDTSTLQISNTNPP